MLDLDLNEPAEIEKRLEDEVARVFGDNDAEVQLAKSLLVKSLAADAGWVQLYIHSGELALSVPSDEKSDPNFKQRLSTVLEVRGTPRVSYELTYYTAPKSTE